jgi:hypothetical protein
MQAPANMATPVNRVATSIVIPSPSPYLLETINP